MKTSWTLVRSRLNTSNNTNPGHLVQLQRLPVWWKREMKWENVNKNLSPLQHRTQWGRQRIAWNCFWMHLSIRTWWKLDMVTVSKEIVIVIMITMCYCFYYLISLQGRRLPARSNLITIDTASGESYSRISFIFSNILCFRLRSTWQ